MDNEQLKVFAREIADALRADERDAVALARLETDFKHLQQDVSDLKTKVYTEHNKVILWVKDFIESYRKVITVVVTSGVITLIGLFIKLWSTIKAGN